MTRDPNDFSPRSTETLPPHVPLDEAAITALWWATSPQARAMRVAKDSPGSRPARAEADTSTAPLSAQQVGSPPGVAGYSQAGGEKGAGENAKAPTPVPDESPLSATCATCFGPMSPKVRRDGTPIDGTVLHCTRCFGNRPKAVGHTTGLVGEPFVEINGVPAKLMFVSNAQAIAWIWRRCWERANETRDWAAWRAWR